MSNEKEIIYTEGFYVETSKQDHSNMPIKLSSTVLDQKSEDMAYSLRETLKNVGTPLKEAMQSLGPNEVEIFIGLKVASKLGWVVAEGSAEGNIYLKLVWKKN